MRNKVIAGFLPLVLLLGAVGATSIQKFAVMNQEVEAITGNYMLAIGYLSEMRNGVMHYRLDITRGILVRDNGEKAVALQKRLD
ncbi:MAG: MCP four helix bundle domain-containing protein [Rhodopila sp.]